MSRKKSTDSKVQKKVKPEVKPDGAKKTKKTKTTKSKATPAVGKSAKKVVAKSSTAQPGVKNKVTSKKQADTQKAKQTTKKGSQSEQAGELGAQTALTETASPVSDSNGSNAGRGLSWVALVCSALALMAGGYAAYQASISRQVTGSQVSGFDDRLKLVVTDQQSLKNSFASLEQKSGEFGQAVDTQVKKITDDLSVAQSTLTALQVASDQSIEAVKANLGASVARWQLDELHALLSQVNQYYQFTGDKRLAMQGLQIAQAKLATIKNPHLTQVSTALAEDITRLESDPTVDMVSLNNRLTSIATLIPELKFILDKKEETMTPVTEESAAASSDDKSILAVGKAILGDIGSLVQHKKRDAPLKPSLDDSARFVLYESLQLKIQTAMAAMLRHDNAVFQSQLQQASTTLSANFDLQDPKAQTVKSELEAMQAIDVSKNTQAISKALTALNSVMVLEN